LSFVVGMDGGSTKTLAMVSNLKAQVLGVGRSGCSNWEIVTENGAARVINDSIKQALQEAKVQPEQILHIHMGLAGMDWPDDERRLRKHLSSFEWAKKITIENDAFLGIKANIPEGIGIGVSAGSGVCSCIICPDGQRYFYGSFTDLGGGSDINEQTLHAIVRDEDGRGKPTSLKKSLLKALGFLTVADLLYAITRKKYVIPSDSIRKVLFKEANQNDEIAVGIITRFGKELSLMAINLIRRYNLTNNSIPIVASGSLMTKTGALLFNVFKKEIKSSIPDARVILTQNQPVLGAVWTALNECGIDQKKIWKQLSKFPLD